MRQPFVSQEGINGQRKFHPLALTAASCWLRQQRPRQPQALLHIFGMPMPPSGLLRFKLRRLHLTKRH